MRLDHARDIVHAWANELDSKTAGELGSIFSNGFSAL